MNLTYKQNKTLNILIEKCGFCTFETQQKLVQVGFFDSFKPHLAVNISNEDVKIVEISSTVPNNALLYFPLFEDVYNMLPKFNERSIIGGIFAQNSDKYYSDYISTMRDKQNACESLCQLWLLLKNKKLI